MLLQEGVKRWLQRCHIGTERPIMGRLLGPEWDWLSLAGIFSACGRTYYG